MIYVNDTFNGHYPVGVAAIVCAPNPTRAAQILQKALEQRGLPQIILAKDMIKFTSQPDNCLIINDGDY